MTERPVLNFCPLMSEHLIGISSLLKENAKKRGILKA